MLLGTSTSCCLLPFYSAAAAEILLGKRAGRTLACEGAGLLLPLYKSRKAGVGCEREHFTETSSVCAAQRL